MSERREQLKEDAIAIWKRGLSGIAADRLIMENMHFTRYEDGLSLCMDDVLFSLQDVDRLLVVGAGKAGASMVAGIENVLDEARAEYPEFRRIEVDGLVSVPDGTQHARTASLNCRDRDSFGMDTDGHKIRLVPGRPAGMNEPTEVGVKIATEMLEEVSRCGSRTGCVMLLSGGGSALLPMPAPGLRLADKLSVIRQLSASGADIEALNVVRKHLSAIKGGKLAEACTACWMATMVISDVLGDPLDLIASGPTVQDRSSPADALVILEQFDPKRELPAAIYRCLEQRVAERGTRSDTSADVFANKPIFLIGNNAIAVDEAGMEAEARGYSAMMWSSQKSEGSAESVGRELAEMILTMANDTKPQSPDCLISGGEPVVQLAPSDVRGKGGRNQQLVLAALQRWMEEPKEVQDRIRDRIVLISAGTDGEDGPTDAAGAFVDGGVWHAVVEQELDVADSLRRNDAYTFFERAGGLFKTGPTGTNVCDLRVATVRRA